METTSHAFSFYGYVQNKWRAVQIHRFNRQIAAKAGAESSLFSSLPDDILLIIFDFLQASDHRAVLDLQWAQFYSRRGRLRRRHIVQQLKGSTGDFVRFSMTNRRIRQLAGPRLFRSVCMGHSWSSERATKALVLLEKSSCAQQYLKELELDIWTESDTPENAKRLLRLGHHFVGAMQALDHVQRMTLTVPASTACALHYAFRLDDNGETKILMPWVKELILSPFMHWIIDFCPNVRSIESNDWVLEGDISRYDQVQAVIEAAARATSLEHFSLHCRWRMEMLEEVVDKLHHLKSLALRGGLYTHSMSHMLHALKKMPNLADLELLDARQVNEVLRHRESFTQWSSDAHFWDGYQTYTHEQVTSKVFSELASLERLCLGGHFKARLQSREEKIIDVRWEFESYQSIRERSRGEDCHDPHVAQVELGWRDDQSVGEWTRIGFNDQKHLAEVDEDEDEDQDGDEEDADDLRRLQEELGL